MSNVCAVFCGGDPVCKDTVRLDLKREDFRIAADSGYKLMKSLGISPHLVVGDFDSSNRPENVNVLSFPVEKDDTDLMLAVREGLARGYTHFLIYSATGGRLDHSIAAIQTLAFLNDHKASGMLISDTERVELLYPGSHRLKPIKGFSLSLFSYSNNVTDLTISGAKYTCHGTMIDNAFPLGVSNELESGEATVSFSSGIVLCIRSKL